MFLLALKINIIKNIQKILLLHIIHIVSIYELYPCQWIHPN